MTPVADSKIIRNPVILTNVKTVEFRSNNGVISLIFTPITISTNNPRIWIDVNPESRLVNFYADTGNGFSNIGSIAIA